MDRDTLEAYQMQEALQRQNIEGQQSAYAPQMFEQLQQQQSALVEQTNPRKVVDNIMLRLQGKKKLPNGQEVVVSKPKMNKKGIEKMWFILDSHINQNIILSHLDRKEIKSLMDNISDDVVDNLALNWKDYGITDKTDLDDINNSILTNIFIALKRAEGQNEKNWLGKISIENISGGNRMPGKNKGGGFWEKFKL